MSMESKELSFKDLSNKLESKIKSLDNPNIELEESVKIYEEAVDLYKECRRRLTDMESFLVKISKSQDGTIVEEQFSGDSSRNE